MKYCVNSVIMTPTATKTLVAGSVCVCGIEFNFDTSWDAYPSKTAVFKHSAGMEREVILIDDRCDNIPWEVLQCPGRLRVGVYGENGESIRPTLWAAPLTVHPGATACEPSEEPTPSKWQQILELLEQVASPTDEKYFDIDFDGIVSLKPEYRGQSTDTSYPYSISDNGSGKDGSKNNELPERIVFPEVINGTAVTGFQQGMLCYNLRVKDIVLPDSITEIPDLFCRNARHLRSIGNTEHITKLGYRSFMNTRIEKALFPNLKEVGKHTFIQCPLLYVANIGNEIAEIPEAMFGNNHRLSCVMGGAKVKTVGVQAFVNTQNLKNLAFLPHVTKIGNYGFMNSRVQFDWGSIKDACTFGTQATPVIDNSADFWSECTSAPCENPVNTLLNQKNPLWVKEKYGSTDLVYEKGCAVFSIMHIHSALSGKTYSSPKEFETELAAIDPALLTIKPNTNNNHLTIYRALGYDVTNYTQSITAEIYQELCNALADGAYIHVSISTAGSPDSGHAVVLHGINSIGEVLVMDSDMAGFSNTDLYDERFVYQIPLQNIAGPSSDFVIVRKK